jgi:molybdate transport system regulatory protein
MTAADHAPLHAALQMRRGDDIKVGTERIALLAAVGELGSISAAAKAAGISYKSAWDAIQALNNLFAQPLVQARPGGRQGGTAQVTEQGQAVIRAFRLLESELGQALGLFERRLAHDSPGALHQLLWGFRMKSSARNALRGTVTQIQADTVNAEVVLQISERVQLAAVISRHSLEALDLQVGSSAVALVKASFVILAAADEATRTSARNQLAGVVIERIDGVVNSEITLELDVGKTLTATLTHASAEELKLTVGARAVALIKASHVILVVE